jgi:hypothetical protein
MTLVLVGMVVLAFAAFVLAWLEWPTPQQTTQHRDLSEDEVGREAPLLALPPHAVRPADGVVRALEHAEE